MNTTIIKRSFVLAVAFALVLLMQLAIAIPTHAAVGNDARAWVSGAVWDGGGDGTSFGDPVNWENDTLPISGDAISINTKGLTDVTFNVDLNTEGGNVSAFDYIRFGGIGAGTFTLTGDDLLLTNGLDNDGDLYNYHKVVVENNITLAGNSSFRAGEKLTLGKTDGTSTLDLAAFTMTKLGEAPLIINSIISGTGGVTVSNGQFVAEKDGNTVAITIGNGGTLKGNGAVGDVTVQSGGEVAPGLSPGCITTGDLTYNSGSTYTVEIDGPTPCTDYDQTIVVGTVTLGGATLAVPTPALPIDVGDEYMIINNDLADAVVGTFADLVEGATFTSDTDVTYSISYVGGDGNDVVLTVAPGSTITPAAPDTGFGPGTVNFLLIATATVLATGGMVIAGRKLQEAKAKK